MTEPGLDAAFLDFIRDPDPEAHRRIHDFYVPFFAGLDQVVDLACGEGAFVSLLGEAGHDAMGVDGDPGCVAVARRRGATVVQRDVGDWLCEQPDASADGFFCAHLVEHLRYEDVLSTFRHVQRVLRPGGRLVVVTPNVRALVSHLELYHMHFGHVAFYHPRLLAFFAREAGFAAVEEGENPRLASPMFGPRPAGERGASDRPAIVPAALPLPRYDTLLPRRDVALLAPWWHFKMWLVRLLVRPFVDPLAGELQAAIVALNADRARLAAALAEALASAEQQAEGARWELGDVLTRLDRSFEAYIVADKAAPGAPVRTRPAAHPP